jgi:hypothetical protein
MQVKEILICVFVFVVCVTAVIFVAPRHGVVRIDCSIAEITPDITPEAREQCRKLRMENVK